MKTPCYSDDTPRSHEQGEIQALEPPPQQMLFVIYTDCSNQCITLVSVQKPSQGVGQDYNVTFSTHLT